MRPGVSLFLTLAAWAAAACGGASSWHVPPADAQALAAEPGAAQQPKASGDGSACDDETVASPDCVDSPEAAHGVGDDAGTDDEEIDDGFESPPPDTATPPTGPRNPLVTLSDDEIERRFASDPASLGSISIGTPNAGRLLQGVQMTSTDRWEVVVPGNAWGTAETVEGITRSIDVVNARFPGTQKMYVGHISARNGGHLSPHVSHQAGRDVDLSYYLTTNAPWYARATATNLDRPRTWTFVKALLTESDVELILIDHSIQRLLREHALANGDDPEWVAGLFDGRPGLRPIIRHAKGHATHLHVRFYSPMAREMAVRAYPLLAKRGLVTPPTAYVSHRAKNGETLGSIANRYGTTVEAIQRANGLRSTKIRAKVTYRIPKKGGVAMPTGPVVVPPRRVPPARS